MSPNHKRVGVIVLIGVAVAFVAMLRPRMTPSKDLAPPQEELADSDIQRGAGEANAFAEPTRVSRDRSQKPSTGEDLAEGSTLVVRLLGQDNEPWPGATIRVRSTVLQESKRIGSEITDSSGRARWTSLPVGRYGVEAFDNSRLVGSSAVTLIGGKSVYLDVQVRDGARFRGRTILSNGLPASDIEIAFLPMRDGRSGSPAGVAWPDARGDFESADLQPGLYVVSISRLSDATQLGLRESQLGREGRYLDLRIQLTGGVRGQIVDDHGLPLVADVFLNSQSEVAGAGSNLVGSTLPGGLGAFEFLAVPAGPYWLSVTAAGHVKAQKTVLVRSGATSDHRLELKPGGAISGQIQTVTGVAGRAEIRLLRHEGNELAPVEGAWKSSSGGAFEIAHIPFGTYDLKVQSNAHSFAAVRGITLSPSERVRHVEVSLGVGGTIAGQATRADGTPASGRFTLRIRHPEAGLRVLAVPLAADGHFEIHNLPAGEVDVEARWSTFRFANPNLIIRDGKTTEWPLRFPPGGQ